MHKYIPYKLAIFIALTALGCKVNKNQDNSSTNKVKQVVLDDVLIHGKNNNLSYHPASTLYAQLIHTKLDVSFNWPHREVIGKAVLTIKPYGFNSLSQINLDARSFKINRVAQLNNSDTIDLSFNYNQKVIVITLKKQLKSPDSILILVDYIAQPYLITGGGGRAITDNKGIYFINHLGTDPHKPMQIWTQGESQYNSGWFPTFDVPNQKHTQEISITVEPKFTTLSNGELIYSNYNKDGTRTDYWQQLKPHAPYLTMMAIGEFVTTKDKWRKKMEVNYLLEPKYAPYAKTIFGVTPEMIEFYSKRTGVDYPWDKFSQVVVRDFVSGAMENTSAVVHYEGVAHTNREHLDNPHEDIIAHELFHHWFGDLVTARSWSQLPLNESFATYGEYLWNEYKHGKPFADLTFTRNLDSYLRSKSKHKVPPIRPFYEENDDMFDVVSYQKGSRILHLLRNEIGDDAFFEGIRLYLTNNRFKAADIHHLRHAMETASGKDLNLFFDQWFIKAGHPTLEVNYHYNNNQLRVICKQTQDSFAGIYNIITTLDYTITVNGQVHTFSKPINLTNKIDTFIFDVMVEPNTASIDPNATLVAQLIENKPQEYWLNQAMHAHNYAVRQRALRDIGKQVKSYSTAKLNQLVKACLMDTVTQMKELGLGMSWANDSIILNNYSTIENLTQYYAASTRAKAYLTLSKVKVNGIEQLLSNAIDNDSSYRVISDCFEKLYELNPSLAVTKLPRLEQSEGVLVQIMLSELFANDTSFIDKNSYFLKYLGTQGIYRFNFLMNYLSYLKHTNDNELSHGLKSLEEYLRTNSDKSTPNILARGLKDIESEINEQSNLFPNSQARLISLKKMVQDKIDLTND